MAQNGSVRYVLSLDGPIMRYFIDSLENGRSSPNVKIRVKTLRTEGRVKPRIVID